MFAHWLSETRKLNRHYQSEGEEGVFVDALTLKYPTGLPNLPVVYHKITGKRVQMIIQPNTIGLYDKKVNNFILSGNFIPILYLEPYSFSVNMQTFSLRNLDGYVSPDGYLKLVYDDVTFMKGAGFVTKPCLIVYYDIRQVNIITGPSGELCYDFSGIPDYVIDYISRVKLYTDRQNNVTMEGKYNYFTDSSLNNTPSDFLEGNFRAQYMFNLNQGPTTSLGYKTYILVLNETIYDITSSGQLIFTDVNGNKMFKGYGMCYTLDVSAFDKRTIPSGPQMWYSIEGYSVPTQFWSYGNPQYDYDKIVCNGSIESGIDLSYNLRNNVLFNCRTSQGTLNGYHETWDYRW